MAGKESDIVRRATSTRVIDFLENEEGMSSERANRLADELLRILTETSKKYREHVNYMEDLIKLQVRHKDDVLGLVKAEDEELDRLNKQLERLEYQADLRGEMSEAEAERYIELKKGELELNKLREDTLSTLTNEEQVLYGISKNEQARAKEISFAKDALEKRILILKEEQKSLDESSAKYRENNKLIDEAQKHLAILGNNYSTTQDPFSQAFGKAFNGPFMKSIGGVIDVFAGKNDSSKKDKRQERIIQNALKYAGVEGYLKNIDKNISDDVDNIRNTVEDIKKDTEDADEGTKSSLIDNLSGNNAISSIANTVDTVVNVVAQISDVLDSYINSSAQFLAANKGQINAALYGWRGDVSGPDYFDSISERSRTLVASTIITQQEYLQAVKSIVQQGIADGSEVAALLTTIAEKTIPQFNATSAYIRRMVLLGEENATQRYFGLESILQKSLNAQFGESSYLNQLFESVNTNLQDAIANLADGLDLKNSYGITQIVQNYLSQLYESGVESSTITRISNAINALGSGNIQALSGDSGMQKLMLLSMDRGNIDYASMLQEGLNARDTNLLLQNMVEYLKDIANSTDSNNVLEAAYSNLFGLSMTDMYAIQNANIQNTGEIKNIDSKIINEVGNRINSLGSNVYTTISEKVDNLFANLQYGFGSDLAGDPSKYIRWKGGKFALDIGNTVSDFGIVGKTAGKAIQALGAGVMMSAAIGPMIGVISDMISAAGSYKDVGSETSNSITTVFDTVSNITASKGSTSSTGTTGTSSQFKALDQIGGQFTTNIKEGETKYVVTDKDIESALNEEDPSLTVLKEFEQTLMENKAGKKAFAVSLQGMDDEVLKSFASIFADESDMKDVFKGTGNKLFDYEPQKTTSSDNNTTNSRRGSTTGSSS